MPLYTIWLVIDFIFEVYYLSYQYIFNFSRVNNFIYVTALHNSRYLFCIKSIKWFHREIVIWH